MRFRSPSPTSPHFKFWEQIRKGGRVWRNDRLNGVQEWIDLDRLGGDANEIQGFGYMDLSIPQSALSETR